MRPAPIAVVALSLPLIFAATAATAHGGCGRHAMIGGAGRVGFHRVALASEPDCLTREQIEERRARRAAHGGFFDVHGRYQH